MNSSLIDIDGSQGEGGGQILRTTIGLCAALGRSVRIRRIRAGREQSGLRPQHVTAVRAVATICQGRLSGDEVGSSDLTFEPGPVQPGSYKFDIGTAGSTTLVLQGLLPALMLADGDTDVTVTGGTHNPMAPSFEYLRDVFGPLVTAANVQAYFEMIRPGFYPAGGGKVHMHVVGLGEKDNLDPIRISDRGQLRRIEGLSAASDKLSMHIIDRQARTAEHILRHDGYKLDMEHATWPSLSPGTTVFVRAAFARSVAGYFALGKLHKPAEQVAQEAACNMLRFLKSEAAVDEHAADQLVTIAALCPAESVFTTECVTSHLLTNAEVVRQLTGRAVTIEGEEGSPGKVTIAEHEF